MSESNDEKTCRCPTIVPYTGNIVFLIKMTRGLETVVTGSRQRKGLAFDKCGDRVQRLCKSKSRCKKGKSGAEIAYHEQTLCLGRPPQFVAAPFSFSPSLAPFLRLNRPLLFLDIRPPTSRNFSFLEECPPVKMNERQTFSTTKWREMYFLYLDESSVASYYFFFFFCCPIK